MRTPCFQGCVVYNRQCIYISSGVLPFWIYYRHRKSLLQALSYASSWWLLSLAIKWHKITSINLRSTFLDQPPCFPRGSIRLSGEGRVEICPEPSRSAGKCSKYVMYVKTKCGRRNQRWPPPGHQRHPGRREKFVWRRSLRSLLKSPLIDFDLKRNRKVTMGFFVLLKASLNAIYICVHCKERVILLLHVHKPKVVIFRMCTFARAGSSNSLFYAWHRIDIYKKHYIILKLQYTNTTVWSESYYIVWF